MAESKIEWTDFTWNPTRGCSRISPGCENCYAERMAARFSHGPVAIRTSGDVKYFDAPFTGFAKRTPSGPRWTGRVELIEDKLLEPLRWRKPRRVFVNSMSDLFHEALPDEAIDRVFAVMALCPQHTFQVLTKRAERMYEYVSALRFDSASRYVTRPDWTGTDRRDGDKVLLLEHAQDWPLPNVWLGVSVEDRKRMDRIDWLRKTPAAVRFLSIEPLLEDLGEIDLSGIDWVITGGESGPGARPAHPDWFRSVRDQCAAAGVSFFFKQWGEWCPYPEADAVSFAVTGVWPDDTSSGMHSNDGYVATFRVGKHAAGRLLDGRTHDELPQ